MQSLGFWPQLGQLAIWLPVSQFCQLCGLSHRKAKRLKGWKTEKLTTQRAEGIDELVAECWTLFMTSQCHKLQAQAAISQKKPKQTLSFFKLRRNKSEKCFNFSRRPHPLMLIYLPEPAKGSSLKFSVFDSAFFGFGFRCKLNTLPGKHATDPTSLEAESLGMPRSSRSFK